MRCDSFRHARRSIRLQGFDYRTPRAYFVTICTWNRFHLLGDVVDGSLKISPIGRVVRDCWQELPNKFPNAQLDEFVVMPNHLHGIIRLVGAPLMAPGNRAPTLGEVIRHFKAIATREVHRIDSSIPIWQRNYYERIIRVNGELERVRRYIRDNPKNWGNDPENM
ncbi:MAG TPA: transposase [bacterium]|nr:transposase [bacterium]